MHGLMRADNFHPPTLNEFMKIQITREKIIRFLCLCIIRRG